MKILWLLLQPILVQNANSYNGGGWIESLYQAIKSKEVDVEFSIAYISDKEDIGGVNTYAIQKPKLSPISKLLYYWWGYKNRSANCYNEDIQRVIKDSNPDIIHIWGIESSFASIIGHTNIPIVVHIQGLLSPYANAFFSQGLSSVQLKRNNFIKERIFRNGYTFAYNHIQLRAEVEIERMKQLVYVMGRTHWDKQLVKLYSPTAQYYHVDEMLRDVFYTAEKTYKLGDNLVITTTISKTIYKGLDVVLKAAAILKATSNIKFEWRVVGVDSGSDFVRLFENVTKISSDQVNIKYLGVLSKDNLLDNLLESSIYVHPSYIDNSPNSLCEAQMVGLANIACNVGGVASLIEHGVSGYLVPANAPHELAYLLRTLAETPSQQIEMGKAARIIALERHNKERITGSLLRAYNDINNRHNTLKEYL